MNKIPPSIGISIVMIVIIYFVGFDIESNQKILEITDYEIIQNENSPLFLSVMVSENIPERLGTNYLGYGYGWLSEDSEKLYGYTTSIHSDSKWHIELITIDNARQFCFDDAELVIISNVVINQNKINVIVEQNDSTIFDKIISYEIIKDNNCHFGYAGKIIDEYKVI